MSMSKTDILVELLALAAAAWADDMTRAVDQDELDAYDAEPIPLNAALGLAFSMVASASDAAQRAIKNWTWERSKKCLALKQKEALEKETE